METMMPAKTFDAAAAVDRLASLWRADCGASPAAFAILPIASIAAMMGKRPSTCSPSKPSTWSCST